MVPMFECSKSYKIMSREKSQIGDDTTASVYIYIYV